MSSPRDELKDEPEWVDLTNTTTVEPLPDSVRAEGGFIVDAENLASTEGLKLAKDGHTVLLPQPTSLSSDPLNWSSTKKHLVLFTVAWGALCADFVGAIGSAPMIYQAIEWHMSPNKANQPNSITVLFLGLFGLVWVPMVSYWGRAPVLFWTEVIGFLFTMGTALSQEYEAFFAMRVMSAVFLTAAQTISLAFLKDIFFFHERARKIGLWAALYIASPYLGPQLASFVVGKTSNWHHAYWMATGCVGIQLILVVLFIDETFFNRDISSHNQPERPQTFSARMSRLLGVWQLNNHNKYFSTILDTYRSLVFVILQPFFTLIALSYFMVFMWAVGINVTTGIVFATPATYGGYGYSAVQLGYLYFSPIVGVLVAEVFGHYFNDFLQNRYIHRHKGVFEPEVRLWPCYIATVFNIPGLVLVGLTVYHHWNVAGAACGWGMFSGGIMLTSVAVTAYSLDCFPKNPAEVAAWLNLARTIGGFSVGYFQQPWGVKNGYDVSFGIQAAICAVSLIPVFVAHKYGHKMRLRTQTMYPHGFVHATT